MTKILAILIAGLVCEAIGVVFLSKGLKQIGEVKQVNAAEVWRAVKAGVSNGNILLGVALAAAWLRRRTERIRASSSRGLAGLAT